MRSLPFVLAVLLPACNGYPMGSLLRDARGAPDAQARTIGCLDVRLGLVSRSATGLIYGNRPDPVVSVELGNRCYRSVRVRLAELHVVARADDGATAPLQLHDRRGEVHLIALDGRKRATVQLEFGGQGSGEMDEPATLSADVSNVNADTPARTEAIRVGRWDPREGGSD